ncbi:MAG: hypothetical protein MRK02_14030 [Candidatus Scalindua sp.]|nr:hypothetical protein [Candidatus Scalindua sp.]
MTFWKNFITRPKRRLPYDDLRRICIKYAKPGLKVEPLSTAFETLAKMDSTKDWFWQWQLDLSLLIKRIVDANSHEKQALQCRIEILENLHNFVIKSIILTTENTDLKDFLLILKYSDVPSLNKSERKLQLAYDYAFLLLNDLGVTGLYEQQFERYLPLDDFWKPYNAICRSYLNIYCYTCFFNTLLSENKDSDVKSTATSI